MIVTGSSQTTLFGLIDNATYFVQVTVVDEACNEASGAEIAAVAPDCGGIPPCPNPVGNSLFADRTPAEAVRLAWSEPPLDASHGAAGSYDIYRSVTRPQDGFSLLGNAPGLTYDDTGAAVPFGPFPRHYYLIVARNACGTSGDEPSL